MSPARQHRDRHAVQAAVAAPPIVSPAAGGQPARARSTAEAQIALRLTHDLRRLKEIKSVALKIAAKRAMLPEYRAWVQGLLAADARVPDGIAGEVLPTVMVWLIDTAAWDEALDIAAVVLRHDVAMPARYNRDAAAVIAEEIADAAIRAQGLGERFRLDVLERAEDLTAGADMHDEVRAKLEKAIGTELAAAADETGTDPDLRQRALAALRRAHALNDRIGVKTSISRIERALALAAAPPAAQAA